MPASPASCVACGTELSGRFCPACGEEVVTAEARTVRHFVATALLDEIVQFDSRFWRTLRALLFEPGRLTVEFIAGRRRAYIGPVKLLLASIFIFVLATRDGFVAALMLGPVSLSVAPTAPPAGLTFRETLFVIDRFGILERQLDVRFGHGGEPGAAAQSQFQARMRQVAQPLSFGNVFFLGAGLYLMFRRRLPYYVDHLVFSMHAISFVLISSLPLLLVYWYEPAMGSASVALALLVFVWQFGYLTTAIRRLYFTSGESRGRARLRAFGIAVVLYLLNGLFVTIVQLIAGWSAIQRM